MHASSVPLLFRADSGTIKLSRRGGGGGHVKAWPCVSVTQLAEISHGMREALVFEYWSQATNFSYPMTSVLINYMVELSTTDSNGKYDCKSSVCYFKHIVIINKASTCLYMAIFPSFRRNSVPAYLTIKTIN